MGKTMIVAMSLLVLVGSGACSKDDMSRFSLGSESYPNHADCKQLLFDGKPVQGVFFKKLIKAVGEKVQGMACHGVIMVADAKTGGMREGDL